MRTKTYIPLFIFLCFTAVLNGQQIKADVEVRLDRLPQNKQQQLQRLHDDIRSYLNDHDWTGDHLDQPVGLTVTIFLADASTAFESRYSGNLLVSNDVDLQYYDRYWRFPYQAGDQLQHSTGVYDPFTGVIDFYVYLVLGSEYDKMGLFAGDRFYEKAKMLAEQAKFNAPFLLGWEERQRYIDKVRSEDYKPFRRAKDEMFLGFSLIEEDNETAKKHCVNALNLLDAFLKHFPENNEALRLARAYHADYFEFFGNDADIWKLYIKLDPENTSTYERYL